MLTLTSEQITAIRERLPAVSHEVVDAIVAEVPSYAEAFSGRMGEIISQAVQLALDGFLTLAARTQSAPSPRAPAVSGAYQLGRGEARSGRSSDAILAAYRIGAREAWRRLAATAVEHGVTAEVMSDFAELVFAYIDELSAASVAGHSDELAHTGRARQLDRERLVRMLLDGAPAEQIQRAAERVEWVVPHDLTAVLLGQGEVRRALIQLPAGTLTLPDISDSHTLLLVPDHGGATRPALVGALRGMAAVIGQAVPWQRAAASYSRARRAAALGLIGDTGDHLVRLVVTADPDAFADLREQALAPLAGQRADAREKLTETLRAWLAHQGRRDRVAEELFVHPQTVRYRVGRLRELYGDRLDDPATVSALMVALSVTGAGAPSSAASRA